MEIAYIWNQPVTVEFEMFEKLELGLQLKPTYGKENGVRNRFVFGCRRAIVATKC